MPEDPNNPIPHRTEPATEPEPDTVGGVPVEDLEQAAKEEGAPLRGEEEGPDAGVSQLNEILTNPATVIAVQEFLSAEGLSLEDVEVTEGFWGWSEGSDIASIKVGSQEYFVSPDDETTTNMAMALVRNDLETEPELFSQAFIERYIDRERLSSMLLSDVEVQVRESPDSYGWEPEELVRFNEKGEEDEDGEFDSDGKPFEEQTEPSDDWVTAKAEEILRDPVAYMQEIYGDQEGVKQAIEISGINIDEAAEDAIAADGEGHFLGTYDGVINDLPSGGQWWRHN